MLGFDILKRDSFGSRIPPQRLFTQYGGLYSGAAPFGEEDLAIGELYIQKIFKKTFGFRFGQIFPITAYDFFPFKNFRTDFTDFNHVTNSCHTASRQRTWRLSRVQAKTKAHAPAWCT